MGKIRILDEQIANQIAAGEVVERPSSVVKELVENAIDAGSTRVDVIVEEGGLQLIRVTDNGSGMESSDCETAFQRHATSKITSGKDLFHIRTLGFRGEALPSIAAVAKVECTTSSDQSGLGRRIRIEGGTMKGVEETAASRGTDFVVRELFFNTPARLKYMKTVQTELGHISDYMYRLALARPDIAFTLKHNGNLLLQSLGNGDLLQVIASVYGTATAKAMVSLRTEHADYTLEGYVSKPELTRANRGGISFVVNGRYIRNYALSNALMSAYHTLLPVHRYPIAVLNIRMDPSLVDVNVHPSKLEVRFSMESELTQLLERTVRSVIGRHVLIPEVSKPAPKKQLILEQLSFYGNAKESGSAGTVETSSPATSAIPRTEQEPGDRTISTEREHRSQPPRPSSTTSMESAPVVERTSSAPAYAVGRRSETPAAAPRSQPSMTGANRSGGSPVEAWTKLYRPPESSSKSEKLPDFPKLYPIGQMHGTYIVAQNQEGLYLIDQHAAHERINYEYYYKKFGQPSQASQELLVPVTLEFTSAEANVLRDKLPMFEKVGVFLEAFGGSTFIVRAYPHWFPSGEEKAIIEEMAEWALSEKQSIDLVKLREKSAILCSCKASVKANQSLSTLEIEGLLERLSQCDVPYTCPHGRPIVVSFSTYELEKMFKRVM
jgi:DNA mismatch repair protein MutL